MRRHVQPRKTKDVSSDGTATAAPDLLHAFVPERPHLGPQYPFSPPGRRSFGEGGSLSESFPCRAKAKHGLRATRPKDESAYKSSSYETRFSEGLTLNACAHTTSFSRKA